ncbi:hypothetical protein [Agromyces humi]|uniref:hypothetical protein n=1 Tax=Agromyces humi TaxID=1766800 RepID=UPI00135CC5D2|nr:hypothetical protein [Agromyces humi]
MSTDSPHEPAPPSAEATDPPRDSDSIARRILRLDVAMKRCGYVAVGLSGLVLLLGPGDLLSGATLFPPIIVTLIVFATLSLGMAYVPLLMETSRLKARLAEGRAGEDDSAGRYDPTPHHWYIAGAVTLAVGGLMMVIGSWLAAFV